MHSISPVTILDTILKSTALLALAWSTALLLKKRSAATQHMVRTFALAAVLLLPFSVLLLPAWHVKGIPALPGFHEATPATRSITATASQIAPAAVPVRPTTRISESHTAPAIATAMKSQLTSET